jgi:potassium-dependent mechanosensitive channel
MPTWRRFFVLAAGLAAALAAVQPGHAQQDPAEMPPAAAAAEPTPAEPAPAEPEQVEDKVVAAFAEAIETWKAEISTQEQAIADQTTTDDELRAIPELLEALRETIRAQKALLKPKLQDTRERLAKLGPVPAEGAPPESAEIAAQRKRLEAEVATIDGKLKQADVLLLRAEQLIDAANDERRERFTKSLFYPVPNFYADVLPTALEALPRQIERLFHAPVKWIERAWNKSWLIVVLLFLATIGATMAMRSFVTNMAWRIDAKQRGKKPAEPARQDCGIWALRKALRSTIPLWVGLIVFYLIATAAGLAAPWMDGVLLKAALAAAWAIFLMALITHSLLPEEPSLAVLPIDGPVAKRLAVFLWAITGVWLADQLWVLSDSTVFTPYQISVLRSALFAALYGVLLAAILVVIRRGAANRKAVFGGWQGWLFTSMAVTTGLILFAMLLGYESLARFVGSHVVSTAGLLWIMYLLHLAAESLSSVSVISGPIDDDLGEEEQNDAPSLLTLRIIASLLLDIAIIAVGVTILLLLWRFDWVEVKGWIQAAFFGVQFGSLSISLQSILIALGVFALGLVLTRFVQRWLTGRVFVGWRAESGLHESVRIGIGYLGFVLAALAGVSYLGVDFSNLAIVAGALSVGIGFGLQSIFNNFVSGLILLVERPIKIGDYIQVGGQEGTVKKISVRSTEIETIHRQTVIIPNATLITDPVTNWMHADKSCRLDIAVGVDYGTDVELLRSTLLEVAHGHRGVLKSPPAIVHFANFGDSALNFELRVFLRDVRDRIKSSSELHFAILKALGDAGISIPFPQRDIHIKSADGKLPEDPEGDTGGRGASKPRKSSR